MKYTLGFLFRLLLGLIFIISGFEKVTQPYQNFVYIIQSYDVVPVVLEKWVAIIFPWIELLVGIFLALGLWTRWMLRVFTLIMLLFMVLISQALIRGLPLSECGCFGSLVQISPTITLVFDSVLFVLGAVLLRYSKWPLFMSLDGWDADKPQA